MSVVPRGNLQREFLVSAPISARYDDSKTSSAHNLDYIVKFIDLPMPADRLLAILVIIVAVLINGT